MVSGQAVKKGQKLVHVPRKLWMTSETARASPICGDLLRRRELDPWKVRRSQRRVHVQLHSLTVCTQRALAAARLRRGRYRACAQLRVVAPSRHLKGAVAPQSMWLHVLCERAQADKSFWAAYLQGLPDQVRHRVR